MNFKEVSQLIKMIDASELAEFQYKTSEVEIKIRSKNYYAKEAAAQQVVVAQAPVSHAIAAPVAQAAPVESARKAEKEEEVKTSYLEIRSPMVGTFYRSQSPDKPSFVQVGDSVQSGSVVCIVEAMKLFNEIESEISGKIVKVMVEDASPVEYDQVLFLVEP